MTDPFFFDGISNAARPEHAAPIVWSDDARDLMANYLAGHSTDELGRQGHRLRRRAENAARTQQYPTVTETTLRAQITQLATTTTEGDTRR